MIFTIIEFVDALLDAKPSSVKIHKISDLMDDLEKNKVMCHMMKVPSLFP